MVCGLTALSAFFSFSLASVSAEKVIFSDVEYKTIDNSRGMCDDSLAEYAYNRWNNVLSSDMSTCFIEFYSQSEIKTYYFSSPLDEINFTYNPEYNYYYSDFLTSSYSSSCASDRGLAGGSSGFSGYLYYYPESDVWRIMSSADSDSIVNIDEYSYRDMRSTIVFTGIDGISPSTASIDVSVSPLSEDMSIDSDKNFLFSLTNSYDYPIQFIVYVSPFSSAVGADYAIKSLSGVGGIFVTETWRYVLSQGAYVSASTISSVLPAVMYIPKAELNFLSSYSDICFDCTQFCPSGSSYSFSADWSAFASVAPDTTYYFNVVACFLPQNADKPFRDKSSDYSHYISVYSQPFSFSSSVPEYQSPTDFVQTAPSESIDWDTTFNGYLQDTYGIDLDTFNTMVRNGDTNNFTNIKTGDTDVSADVVLSNFNALVGDLGGLAGALGSVIDTGGLGFSSAVSFDDLLNLNSNPKATIDGGTGEITIIDNSKSLSDYYKDYYGSQTVNNSPVFNNSVTVGSGGTGTGLDIPDTDFEKYTSAVGRLKGVFDFCQKSVSALVPADIWALVGLGMTLSLLLMLLGRN